jgi:DNA-directed RNA polymerase specialized sigma24 family protein
MSRNDYSGVIESWEADLIGERAKRLGIRASDLDDVQQEIILDVLAFEFDPARSNGATVQTALTALIDHRLMAIRRQERRYRLRLDQLILNAKQPSADDSDSNSLALDVRDAIESLPDREKAVCRGLAAGKCLGQIAQELHIGWPRLKRSLVIVRKHFHALGLDLWLR